jgi:hypothetical protein
MNPIKLYVWTGASLVAIVALVVARKRAGKTLPELKESLKLAASIAGFLAPAQIIYQALTNQQLQQILEIDGCVALILGAAILAGFAGQDIKQLFQ